MRFINIAEQQIRTRIKTEELLQAHQDFFEEYFSVFEDRAQFEKNIGHVMNKIEYQQTMVNINILEERLSNLISLMTPISDDILFPSIIFFVGLGSWDGHGIIINGKPFTFFDMTRMNNWMANSSFILEPHLIHEVFHAIHYYYSPEFYLKTYESVDDQCIKRMIAEGVATHLAESVTKIGFVNSLWLGLLDEMSVREWVERCEGSRKSTWRSIKKAISSNIEDEYLLNTLFSVPGTTSDLLIKGRFGYYFGAKIAEQAAQDVGNFKILSMDLDEFRKYVELYFEEN